MGQYIPWIKQKSPFIEPEKRPGLTDMKNAKMLQPKLEKMGLYFLFIKQKHIDVHENENGIT